MNWNRILIIKPRAIGDVILSTPVIHNLRSHFPHAQIDFVVEKAAYPLLANDPHLDHVFIAPHNSDLNLWNELRFLRSLQNQQYDVCLDLFSNVRTAWISYFSGAKKRVGFNFRGRKYVYHVRVPYRSHDVHEVDFNLDMLRYLGIPVQQREPKIALKQQDREKAQKILSDLNFNNAYIVALNPSGGWEAKKWPLSHFVHLGKILHRSFDIKLLILWGPGEYAAAARVAGEIGDAAALHPKTNLSEQAALLSRCDLFVGNDSGPMHLAAAVGIPTIGLYGATQARLQGPFGKQTKSVFNDKIPCLGCDRLTCPLVDCMNYLSAEKVFDAVVEYVENGILPFNGSAVSKVL